MRDLAPTFHVTLRVPVAADMPGRDIPELFEAQPVVPVATRALASVAAEAAAGAGDRADRQLRDQLEALGDIDAEGRSRTDVGASRPARQ